jgi:hypothetical protein
LLAATVWRQYRLRVSEQSIAVGPMTPGGARASVANLFRILSNKWPSGPALLFQRFGTPCISVLTGALISCLERNASDGLYLVCVIFLRRSDVLQAVKSHLEESH